MKMLKSLSLSLLFGLSTLAVANEAVQTSATAENPPIQPLVEAEKAVEKKVENKTATNPNLVNINTASAAELQDKLVGIGAKKAQAIVDYRTKNGNFVSLEQLTEVSGIGKATLDKNRDRIVLE
ncbi:transporter [Haemophilus paracuniculus]|uniref:Transporter n=1 Tax=Haemophilus paracuniculus TaxID=734 RepID=A0A1T0AT29_9PAST|nr:helix-hairpin-helix domain-containing protein [Haemophilus paracuniculus]OOR99756.1 transporter [Haemophilus paracuniculus]